MICLTLLRELVASVVKVNVLLAVTLVLDVIMKRVVRKPKLNLEPLLYWIKEREEIRKRKGAVSLLQPAYTTDPILATYRFCNVRRRDDRVSQWLIKNVLSLYGPSTDLINWLFFTALCRWINWPPTIDVLLKSGFSPANRTLGWAQMIPILESIDDKIWTSAYTVCPKEKALKGKSKAWMVINEVMIENLAPWLPDIVKVVEQTHSKQAVWQELCKHKYWGSFMAGQVVDDWSWTPFLKGCVDQYTWAPQGPGSIRGLNRLLGEPLRTRHSEEVWGMLLRQIREAIIKYMGSEYNDLSLHDVQNCLCETDKYLRVKNGEGKPRSFYRPETAYTV